MFRRAAFVVLALAINPALVRAQETVLTVTVQSADVYKAPSNVTPVVGHVALGTVLPIERNLGSWVRIAWPDAADGFAYVHVTMGRIGPARTADAASVPTTAATRAAAAAPVRPVAGKPTAQKPAAGAAPVTIPPLARPTGDRSAPRAQGNVAPASHLIGFGGLVGYSRSIGGSARVWHDLNHGHVGAQFRITRNTLTSDLSPDRFTSMQIEPAIVYGLFDRITDYVWLRPYVGSAVAFRRQTSTAFASVSDNTTGARVFGGAEFTFASAPRFGVSADAGYGRFQAGTIPGFEPSRVTASIAGHWYVR
jgi:hypothetical protein